MEIYLLSTSDVWKSTSSQRILWCGTNPAKLYFTIKKEIEKATFNYIRYNEESNVKEQAEDFLYDLRYYATNHKERMDLIQTHLDYAVLDILEDNEYC